LLTGDDAQALELFGHLIDPNREPGDLAKLEDLLADRDAQVSILREQYRHLAARHEPLCDAYRDLQQRMPGHVVDNDAVAAKLRERIEALRAEIAGIPGLQAEIDALTKERDRLLDAKDALFRERGAKWSQIEDDLRRQVAALSEDKAAIDLERRRLEENDARVRERYETIKIELKQLKERAQEMKAAIDEREARKRKMHEQLQRLENAGIETGLQTRAVWTMATTDHVQPSELVEEHRTKVDEYSRLAREVKELKKNCVRLKDRGQMASERIQSLTAAQDRLRQARAAMFMDSTEF
jgi:hypothetical protein